MLTNTQTYLALEALGRCTKDRTTFNVYSNMVWLVRSKQANIGLERHNAQGKQTSGTITPKDVAECLSKVPGLGSEKRHGKIVWVVGDAGLLEKYKQSVDPRIYQLQF